jgi:hypothetical protein
MPISANRFENIHGEDESPNPGTNAYMILSFLSQHADKAFAQGEITESTGVTWTTGRKPAPLGAG